MFNAILLPIDLASEASWKKPLKLAIELARAGGGTVHVMTVLPDFGKSVVGTYFDKDFEHEALDDMSRQIKAFVTEHLPGDVRAKPHVAHGSIYDEIMRAADKLGCDAIVLAAHRPELKDYLLGPNAARVVRHANQSVLVVRD
jgi:nucleotide-binding universal stress UspA family protein